MLKKAISCVLSRWTSSRTLTARRTSSQDLLVRRFSAGDRVCLRRPRSVGPGSDVWPPGCRSSLEWDEKIEKNGGEKLTNFTERRARYRRYFSTEACYYPASVFDPVSARLAEQEGYEMGMLAGSVASATVLGAPDLVLLTLTEFAEQIRRITRASALPLMVDADHGYGNALNAMRTVEELENAGVAALTLEDTALPRRYGQGRDDELISVSEFSGKLKAAVAARQDPALVILGRTAAPRFHPMDAVAKRIKACEACGVDGVFLVGIRSRQEVRDIHELTRLPVVLGTIPPELQDRDFLGAHGVRVALQGHFPFMASIKALQEAYAHLRAGGAPVALKSKTASNELQQKVLLESDYNRWIKDYLVPR